MKKVKVVVDNVIYNIDKQYDFLLPDSFARQNLQGCRVIVPFGYYNSPKLGMIFDCLNYDENGNAEKTEKENQNTNQNIKLKTVIKVIDDAPVLNEEMFLMVKFLKERTFCTYFEAIKCILPYGMGVDIKESFCLINENAGEDFGSFKSEVLNLLKSNGNEIETRFFLTKLNLKENSELYNMLLKSGMVKKSYVAVPKLNVATLKFAKATDIKSDKKLTANQKKALEFLNENGTSSFKEIELYSGVSVATVKNLEKYGLVNIFEKEYYRTALKNFKKDNKKINLNKEQEKCFNGLKSLLFNEKPNAALLYGITGSGKTSVYLKLIEEVLKKGKTAIFMVPEISLTPQTLNLFLSRFGDKVAVFHSALSNGQKMDEFRRCKNNEVSVVLGTRSAIFAPIENIGIIIIDEEQEHTYKSEQAPRFNTKDLAKFRCAKNNALLLLGSATPSFESYAMALNGKYSLFKILNRYNNALLPEVITVDMTKETKSGNKGIFSNYLIEEIQSVLENGEQAIILLNRRGHNTYLSCPKCGYVFKCDNCSISMTYHSDINRLVCHYCGSSKANPKICPECGNELLRYSGFGTQKACEELGIIFKEAKVLRLDADSTAAKESFQEKLSAFANKEYNILVGTQMVAKGLDFPLVTLVGVLSADNTIMFDDYKSYERSFSLLTQVVGRSGRGKKPGKAVIQTLNPNSNVIKMAKDQNYEMFFNEEIKMRKLLIYPPYCDIVLLGFVSEVKDVTINAAKKSLKILTQLIERHNVKAIILGPAAATVPYVSKKFRYRILLKTKNNKNLREMLKEFLFEYYNNERKCAVFIDINPENIM